MHVYTTESFTHDAARVAGGSQTYLVTYLLSLNNLAQGSCNSMQVSDAGTQHQ